MSEDEKNLTEMKDNDALVKMEKYLRGVEIAFICMGILCFLWFFVLFLEGFINRTLRIFFLEGAFIVFRYTFAGTTGICFAFRNDQNFQYLDQSVQEKFKKYGNYSIVLLMISLIISWLIK